MSLSQKIGMKIDHNQKLEDKKHFLDMPAIQFQFLDRKVSSLTQNYFLKRGISKNENISPKVKLSQATIYKLKPNNMLDKIQTQKRQALKTQWHALMKTKQQSSSKPKQQKQPKQQKILNFSKLTKLNQNSTKQSQNLSQQIMQAPSLDQKVQYTEEATGNKFNDEDTFKFKEQLIKDEYSQAIQKDKPKIVVYNEEAQTNTNKHIDQKIIIQKQDNFVADLSYKIKIEKSSVLLDRKDSRKFQSLKRNYEQKYLNAQKIRQKSYTQQTRQIVNIQLNNDNDAEQVKRKASIKSEKPIYQRKKQPNKQMNSKIKRKTYINMSKTVMVQKIINLRKSFNDKYNSSQPNNKNLKEKSNNHRNQNESQLVSVISCQNSLNNNFLPTPNDQQLKKVSFNQIFRHQKHKMERLKRFVSQGKVKYQQNLGHYQYPIMSSTKLQDSYDTDMGKIQFDWETYEQNLIFQDFTNLDQDKTLISRLQILKGNDKEKMQKIQSQNQKQKQRFFNISSLEKKYDQQTIQANLTKYTLPPQLNYLKRQPNSHITTYNFDHIRKKKCQNAQVKELRHKYLHVNNIQHKSPANKKKFSKQECHKYGISIVSVYDKDEMTLNGEKKKFHTEPYSDECLEVQRKNSVNLRKNDYMYAIKTRKIGSKSNGKFNTLNQLCKNSRNKQGETIDLVQFQPWQNSGPLPEYERYQDYQFL